MKKAVFSQPWGGLGDNLACTNLPTLFSELGINFYISYMNYSRNKDIYNLCWRNNKNVKRFKKIIPNIGFKTFEESGYKVFKETYNSVQNTNVAHGFEPGFGYPEIHLDKGYKNTDAKILIMLSTFRHIPYLMLQIMNITKHHSMKK